MAEEKFDIQNEQYNFPYHYIPHIENKGSLNERVFVTRQLWWGLHYLTYMQYILEKVIETKPKKVLDIGCGDGRLSNLYNAWGGGRISGVDLSQQAIGLARALNPTLEFRVEDICEDSKEKYDCATLIEVLEHIPDGNIEKFLKGIANLLELGGKLYITVPSTNQPLHPKHYRHYTPDLLKKQVSKSNCNFKIIECKYIFFEPKWVKIYKRFTMNRLYQLHIPRLDTKIYNWLYKHVEDCGTKGLQVYAELKKI